ncbi:hypothetical protein B0O79_0424 [Flavobacteriaceae bacterium MAR_2009_75]|nr:hypothetical protein B0O79_0424 [Flavobacteriaceae bacterium MAR_2009_75]
MKSSNLNVIKLMVPLFTLILSISCSKDTDLLTDLVVSDSLENQMQITILKDDYYSSNNSDELILDVLSNDIIANPDDVKIIETTDPKNGIVVINEDDTLTYIPTTKETNADNNNDSDSEEVVQEEVNEEVTQNQDTPEAPDNEVNGSEDSFTYTTETEEEDGSTTKQEATVVITQMNDDVLHWKRRFDLKWKEDDASNAEARSKSRNKRQEYYFLAHLINGQIAMWQATGDNEYLDTTIELIDNTIEDAVSVGNGFLGWPTDDGTEYNLWDTFYWRHVATLVRIMHESPNLRASGYQSKYEELLAFSEKHIWDRYESYGRSSLYRSRTHMASHWARLGMELYIVTGKKKYKEVFDNISHGKMEGYPSNLRDQLFPNPKNSAAYAFDKSWGVSKGSDMQDISHAGAIVHFWVLAEENGMYWNRADMDALRKSMDIFWTESDPSRIKNNVDGSGGYTNPGRLHEWFYLARYDAKLQKRLRETYDGKHLNFFGSQVLGIGALNAKILTDGRPIYPEN